MFKKIKKYKMTILYTILSLFNFYIFVFKIKNNWGYLWIAIPLVAYYFDYTDFYNRTEKFMKECRDDKDFKELIRKHEKGI